MVSTKLKLRIANVTIDNATGVAGSRTRKVNLALHNANNVYSIFPRTESDANASIGNNIDPTGDFRINNNPNNNVQINSIRTVSIKLPEKEAEKLFRLVHLRNKVKGITTIGSGTNQVNEWWVTLNGLKYDNGVTANVFNDEDKLGSLTGTALALSANSFKSQDIKSILSLDDITLVTTADSKITTEWDYSTVVNAFLNLETKLEKLKNWWVSNESEKFSVSKIKQNVEFLKKYVYDRGAANNGVPTNAPDTAEKAVYGLIAQNGGGNYVYRDADNNDLWRILEFLQEAKVWNEKFGLETLDEILKANAAGFHISRKRAGAYPNGTPPADLIGNGALEEGNANLNDVNTNTTLAAIAGKQYGNKNYRGFKIVDETKKTKLDGDYFDGTHAFGLVVDNAVDNKFNKANIEAFRAVFHPPIPNTSHADYPSTFLETVGDKWTYRGFQPGDDFSGVNTNDNTGLDVGYIVKNVRYNIFAKDGTNKIEGTVNDIDNQSIKTGTPPDLEKKETSYFYNDLTKGCFDILQANGVDAVLDVFYGDFDGAPIGKKKEVLDKYLVAAQSNRHGGATSGYLTWTDDQRKRLAKEYKILAKFLDAFDVDYSDTSTWNKTKATELGGKKTVLQDCMDGINKNDSDPLFKIYFFWQLGGGDVSKVTRNQISDKIDQINNAITQDDKAPPSGDKFTKAKQNDLDAKIKDTKIKDPAKKIYDEFNKLDKDDDKKTDAVYDALVTLIGELESTSSWDDKPGEWESGYKSGDKQKAWDFVNEQTKNDDAYKSKGGWAKHVAADKKGKLDAAIATAKTVMTDETGAGDKILADVKSVKVANEIKKLFEFCKKALGTVQSSEWEGLKKNIKKYQGATTGDEKTAWDCVNKYQKSGSTKGYATEAWEKAEKGEEKRNGDFANALKEATPQDVYNKHKALDKNDRGRVEAAVALKNEASDKAKELKKAFSLKNTSEYSENKDKIDESITEIQKHIALIEEIIKAKDTDNSDAGKIKKKLKEIESVDSEFKVDTFLNYWKGELESRKTALEAAKQTQQNTGGNNNKTPEPSWYSTWWGIFLIIAAVVAVLGGIAWLIKANSSEEGEGESE